MTESTPSILKRKFRFHSWEVDTRGVARPGFLFSFMLDSAWAHANNSEFSYDALKEEGQLWVLSRFLAVFHKLPKWDDEITVETWGKGADKLFGLRDFIIWSDKEEKLVSATSAWLVIDRKTSRIQRIDLLNSNFPHQLDTNALDVKLGKIEEFSVEDTGFEHTVRDSDLDVNGHVNSAKYMEWILDSFPPEIRLRNSLASIEINFLSEARRDEKVSVWSGNDGESSHCDVKRVNDDSIICRSIVRWEPSGS